MKRWSFSKFAEIYHRDKLKLVHFAEFDPIYMVIGALSIDYLGYISEPVGDILS